MSIATIPMTISETGQEKNLSKCSTVNLCAAADMPARPEKKKDFICRATLLKTNAILKSEIWGHYKSGDTILILQGNLKSGKSGGNLGTPY
ncbi:MAG TPA: hypothetical protein VJJ98_05735 [Sedimentisphaerales bacterium]|nr:hypothetical protein [Sedimentisphaerales bacterium]